ncbi:peptidase A4 family-domain-containing protein [Schizophyllum fasciatum]
MGPLTLAALICTAATALARPSTFAERAARRGAPAIRLPSASNTAAAASGTATSGNWAGLVLEAPPSGENFTSVTGTFTVPALANSTYTAACAWVGIDGWAGSATDALFQAGVDFWMEDGALAYNAWYEWVPDTSWNFTDFAVEAGDVIALTLAAANDSAGSIAVDNKSSGQSTSIDLTAPPIPNAKTRLALQNAEWIMEDFFWYGQVPLGDFGSIQFTDASAKTNKGTVVGLKDATVVDLILDKKKRTETTIDSGTSATIKYLPA